MKPEGEKAKRESERADDDDDDDCYCCHCFADTYYKINLVDLQALQLTLMFLKKAVNA